MTHESEQTEAAIAVEIDADTCLEAAAATLAGPHTRSMLPGPYPHCM